MTRGRDLRHPDHPIDPLFLDRWSPRSMTGEPITLDELHALFEAARWAPSAGNLQPWKILYARRDTPAWPVFFDLLNPGNQTWCAKAGALVLFISRTIGETNGRPIATHAFDTGAAWENFALQGTLSGLVVHGLGGYDHERAREVLGIPEEFTPQIMAAVGKRGPVEDLPESLQAREVPSARRPLGETVVEGAYRV